MTELRAGSSLASPSASPAASVPSEDRLTGGRLLRQAFREAGQHTAHRAEVIIFAQDPDPPALMIQHGTAYSSHAFRDGRRAIIDVFLPPDVVGIEHVVSGRLNRDVIAASPLGYRRLPAQTLRQLITVPEISAYLLGLMATAKGRVDRHVIAVTRMDAYARLASFLLGMYHRFRRAGLISRPTFNLDLTQDEIGDYLGLTTVHVSRTLRRMRQERLAIFDRGAVMILDVERLRAVAAGVSTELPSDALPQDEPSDRAL